MAGTLDGRMRRETPESLQSDPEAPVSSTKLPGAVGRRWGRSVRGAGSLPVHGLSSRQLCGRGCPSVRPVNPEICPGTRQRWPRHLRPKHFPVSWGPEPLPPPLCRPSGMRLSLPRLLPFPFPDALCSQWRTPAGVRVSRAWTGRLLSGRAHLLRHFLRRDPPGA